MPWPIEPPGPVKDPGAVKAISPTEHHDTIALLLHDRDGLPPGQELCALTCAWGTVIEQEPHRQNARRWCAQFATANRKRARSPDPVAADVRRFARIGPSVDGPGAAAQHVVAQLREMTPGPRKKRRSACNLRTRSRPAASARIRSARCRRNSWSVPCNRSPSHA